MQNFQDALVGTYSLELTGWRLTEVQGVSSDGRALSLDDRYAILWDAKVRSNTSLDATDVLVTNDKEALKVQLTEENIHDKYPWDFKILTTKFRKRYSDFKANQQYHNMKEAVDKRS